MPHRNLTIALIVICSLSGFAQNPESRTSIIHHTNVERLNEIAEQFKKDQDSTQARSFPKTTMIDSLTIGYFLGLDGEGNPVYYSLDNASSAASSRIDVLRPGGSSLLDLDGAGIDIGLWDGGPVRATHQEFDTRVTIIDPGPANFHATHVAGILIASGVDTLAKGMAVGATISSYTAQGYVSELASYAANGGLISSHSYVLSPPGSDYEKYGMYNWQSAQWDDIAFNAPYLVLCTGASNNGHLNYNPDNSRYDLLPTNKISKNAIVIGSCLDVIPYSGPTSVAQAFYTSWGPTDDWRIKPDITAVGSNSYSTENLSDTHYKVGHGCSYATPVVSGGLALLQQYFFDQNGSYMRASTAKALILSTTDEAGSYDGPDFSNGWGLFNAQSAANLITDNGSSASISELSLNNGDTIQLVIESDGTEPLVVGICWTDPQGTPVSPPVYNDPTSMLVNDLDVRVIGSSSTYFPWRMEPNATYDNYEDSATKGDNYRDNFEKIEVQNIPAGIYTVQISHKGTLQGGSQEVSLVIDGVTGGVAGLIENSIEDQVRVYPNPTSGSVNIEFEKTQEALTINILNATGQLIKTKREFNSNLFQAEIDGPEGVYLVEVVKSEQEKAVFRLVKQ